MEPSKPTPPREWQHWDGDYFTARFPEQWKVFENASGVDITEPGGNAVVSFAYATGAPTPSTPDQVRTIGLQGLGITAARFVKESASAPAEGGVTRVTEFTGLRQAVPWQGVLTVTVFDDPDNHGFSGHVRMASVEQWAILSGTLKEIEKSILLLRRR